MVSLLICCSLKVSTKVSFINFLSFLYGLSPRFIRCSYKRSSVSDGSLQFHCDFFIKFVFLDYYYMVSPLIDILSWIYYVHFSNFYMVSPRLFIASLVHFLYLVLVQCSLVLLPHNFQLGLPVF